MTIATAERNKQNIADATHELLLEADSVPDPGTRRASTRSSS